MESNFARQLKWIAAADAKVSFIFTIDTAMLGVLAAVSPKVGAAWAIPPAIFSSITVFFGVACLLLLSFSSFPRTNGPTDSLIFFGGITRRDATSFRDATANLSSSAYIEDLSAQCYRNAEIAHRKFKWLQRALGCLYLAVPFWVVSILLIYKV